MMKVKIRLRVSARECIVHRGDFGLRAASVKCQQESECALVGLVLHPGKAIEIDEALEGAGRTARERGQTGEQLYLGIRHRLVECRCRGIPAEWLRSPLSAKHLADQSGIIGARCELAELKRHVNPCVEARCGLACHGGKPGRIGGDQHDKALLEQGPHMRKNFTPTGSGHGIEMIDCENKPPGCHAVLAGARLAGRNDPGTGGGGRECPGPLGGGINSEGCGLGKRGAFRMHVASSFFRLGGAARKNVHFGGKALHVAGLKSKKIVRLAPADAKIGLQQIRAAKHETNQLQAPPDSDAERQRRANKNDFPQT